MLRGRDLWWNPKLNTFTLGAGGKGKASGWVGVSVGLEEGGGGGAWPRAGSRGWAPGPLGRGPLCHLHWNQVSYFLVKMKTRYTKIHK